MGFLRREKMLFAAWFTTAVFAVFGEPWLAQTDNILLFGGAFLWLFFTILGTAMAVVRHADCLADQLGEPFGTLILTLSVIIIEVSMISAVMLTGGENQTLARDTMFAVIMIVMNGLIGVTLLMGGWRHREQHYNLQGANSFLAIILPLSVLGLIMPNFTHSTSTATYSFGQEVFLVTATLALYGIFLAAQTMRHQAYFVHPAEHSSELALEVAQKEDDKLTVFWHSALLLSLLAPVVILSEHLAVPVEHAIHKLGAPEALGGMLIAVLILSPEAMGGFRAALNNRLQRAVNIYLGSVAATIGLTIPAVLVIGMITGQTVVLGLSNDNVLLLGLTLVVSILTFITGRTNIILGAVHLVLFGTYVVLIFD